MRARKAGERARLDLALRRPQRLHGRAGGRRAAARHDRDPASCARTPRSSSTRSACARSCAATPTTSRCRSCSPATPRQGRRRDAGEAPEQINAASALWTRPKAEISDEQYKEFYHHVAHAFDEPWARLHVQAEGMVSYQALLFVPAARPLDLYDPQRQHGVKLYVRRVFITDDLEGLMPRYLRFVRGVVDSEDLQLNVSRETLQHSAVLARISKDLVKRLLDELERRAKAEDGDYATFWDQFGAVLKEGLYEDHEQRERLLELARFRSTAERRLGRRSPTTSRA